MTDHTTIEQQERDRAAPPEERRLRLAIGTKKIDRIEPSPIPVAINEDELAQIIHDLKGPLNTISLETMLLMLELHDSPRAITGALARIRANAEMIGRQVHDLLDLCALDAGELVLTRTDTEMRTLLETVVERAVSSRDHDRVVLEGTARLVIAVDDLRIQRVVGNLITNALVHAPRPSGIVVRLEAVGGGCRVSVIDAGPGVDPAVAPSLFERYRHGAHAGSHGLGLFVSRRIVEAHAGHIGVDSVRGVGSRFWFELPASSGT